jgi:hypothetical protein
MASRPCERTTPTELVMHRESRAPETDPTLGLPVELPEAVEPFAHRLVTIGDSLTHGFMSAAIHRTDISWPAIVAYELGLQSPQFRFPTYEWPTGPGGLPFDLERLARAFESRFGSRLDFWEIVTATAWLQRYMDGVEDYWERGPGTARLPGGRVLHNLGVYGWDVLDAALLTSDVVAARIQPPKDDLVGQIVQAHGARAALRVLDPIRSGAHGRTVLEAAAAMGQDDGGVESLVVVLGSNNALGAVLQLQPCWTSAEYLDWSPQERLRRKSTFTVWRPEAFAADWAVLVEQIKRVRARHVVVATVPAVTIAPIARGTEGKLRPSSRYFPHYTRPWVSDADFDPRRDPCLTGEEARAIDSAIDAYNATIVESVRQARREGLDWLLFDLGGLLDRLATRRYIESPWARPAWWTPYELPEALRALDPVPNTRFFRSGPDGRTDGGLFSLDGVHPTTVGYGVLAREVIKILQAAGVQFLHRDGTPRPPQTPVEVDFARLLRADTLLSNPPAAVSSTLGLLGWLDQRLDWVKMIFPLVPNPL